MSRLLTSAGDESQSVSLVPDSPAICRTVEVSVLPNMFVQRWLPWLAVRHHPILSVADSAQSPSHPELGTLERPTLRSGRRTWEDESQIY